MWRQNNQDSDQSISDEEDFNHNSFINPRTSIKPRTSKMSVLGEVDSDFLLSSKNLVESIADEDHISDDDENRLLQNISFPVMKSDFGELESVKQDETSTWSSVFEETKELMRLQENDSSALSRYANYEVKKIGKGSRSKSKPKFSFGLHSDREASLSLIVTDKNDRSTEVHQDFQGFEELGCETREHSMAELLEGLQKDNKSHSESRQQVSFELSAGGQRNIEHPIAEALEGLLENHGPNKELKGKRLSLAKKKVRSSVAYRASEEGGTSEPLDSSTSSDDEAAKYQLQVYDKSQLSSTALEINGPTMADRFHEALNAAAANDQGMLFATNKVTSIGYYGRLQEVMQIEKERHTEFLNQLQTGIRKDEARFIDVKILSRYLDAKLTVCQCSLGKNIENSQCARSPPKCVDTEEKRTIIFSTRICNNVELEVGNFVRVHPPWKEVEVKSEDAGIILCTYFSQIPI